MEEDKYSALKKRIDRFGDTPQGMKSTNLEAREKNLEEMKKDAAREEVEDAKISDFVAA